MTIDGILDQVEQGLLTVEQASKLVRERLQTISAPRGLDGPAYEQTYRDYGSYVSRCLQHCGAPAEEAADLAQQVWLRAWKTRRRYDSSRASIATWLSGIVRRAIAEHRRSGSRLQTTPLEDHLDDAALAVPPEATLTDLRDDLKTVLTPLDMKLLPLMEEGRGPTEIAIILNVNIHTVEKRIRAFRERVKKYLDGR